MGFFMRIRSTIAQRSTPKAQPNRLIFIEADSNTLMCLKIQLMIHKYWNLFINYF